MASGVFALLPLCSHNRLTAILRLRWRRSCLAGDDHDHHDHQGFFFSLSEPAFTLSHSPPPHWALETSALGAVWGGRYGGTVWTIRGCLMVSLRRPVRACPGGCSKRSGAEGAASAARSASGWLRSWSPLACRNEHYQMGRRRSVLSHLLQCKIRTVAENGCDGVYCRRFGQTSLVPKVRYVGRVGALYASYERHASKKRLWLSAGTPLQPPSTYSKDLGPLGLLLG
ncbi:uncharacterized protein P884DRAFT_91860 [Thermothelomyces heterothallicus CBS 202.75]|uniref:uncharacterized protein n=1 Tax=Thermothelomyces heterothallicus CBS 202.75 TaxID=1149848 RepID=UPI003743133F